MSRIELKVKALLAAAKPAAAMGPTFDAFLCRVGKGVLQVRSVGPVAALERDVSLEEDAGGDEASFTLPTKVVGLLKELPPEASVFLLPARDGAGATMTGPGLRARLPGPPAGDYPALPTPDGDLLSFGVDGDLFLSRIDAVLPMAGVNDARTYLNGVLVELSGGVVNLVAVDGHRMGWEVCPVVEPVAADIERQIILSRDSLTGLKELSRDGVLRITMGERWAIFEQSGTRLHLLCLEGKYPNYRLVVNESALHKVEVNAVEARQVLRRLLALKEALPSLRFEAKEGKVTAALCDVEAEQEIPVRAVNETWQVGLNVKYVIDALAAVRSDRCVMQVAGETDPVLFIGKDEPGDRQRYLVMPLRL